MANGTLLYNTGTLGVTNGQVNFTIAGAAGIKDALPYGAVIRIRGDNRDYEATITSDTAGAFNEAYAGTTNAAAPYDAIKINSIAFAATTLANVATTYSGVAKLTAGDQYFNFNRNATANRAGMILQTAGADKYRVGMMANDNFEVQQWDTGSASWLSRLSLSAAGVLTIASLLATTLSGTSIAYGQALIGNSSAIIAGEKLNVQSSNLGYVLGNEIVNSVFMTPDDNISSIQIASRRQADGTGWTTSRKIIRHVVDSTLQGFLAFGASNVVLGSGAADLATLNRATGQFAVLTAIASTSTTTGSIVTPGGVGIGGALNVGGSITVGTTSFTAGSIGSSVSWGMIYTSALASPAIGQFAWYNYNASVEYARIDPTGNFKIGTTTAPTSATTGALTVAGGVGIGSDVYIGGRLYVLGSNIFLSSANCGFEIGAPSVANTPFIDFHSGGFNSDYDFRLIVNGGNSNGTSGGGSLVLSGAQVTVSSLVGATSSTTGAFVVAGGMGVGGVIFTAANVHAAGYQCRAGLSGAYSNTFNLFYDGAGNTQLWIDNTNFGNITVASDYRIKKDIADASGALDRVLKLRPISYKHQDIDLWKDDGLTREGFIAHELAAIIPSAVNGMKDALTADDKIQPQTLNPFPVISVLTKAVQELATDHEARIIKLEQRLAA